MGKSLPKAKDSWRTDLLRQHHSMPLTRFERDPKQKDRIYLDLNITPYFPAKSFVIKLDGTKGDDDVDWDAIYEQQAGEK